MDDFISGLKESSLSMSPTAASMVTEKKGNQQSRMSSPLKNQSTLGSSSVPSFSGIPSSSNGHLNLHDGPSTLIRRNSGNSAASSNSSKGKQQANASKNATNHNKNDDDSKITPKKTSKKTKNPLRVLGIALIVDQKRTGARMLARYPTSQASVKKDEDEDHEDDDLFFTLTARQMAKLFRTKRSLCNQPMTLRVNKTIFCCNAVLFKEVNHSTQPSSSGNNNDNGKDNEIDASSHKGSTGLAVTSSASSMSSDGDTGDREDNSLRLFSVVVALAPSTSQSALPFSGFEEFGGLGGVEDRSHFERFIRQGGNESSRAGDDNESEEHERSKPKKKKKNVSAARVSSAFLAIRRVHISLIRFCRALEREENRCGYVTHQSHVLFQTRMERQKQLDLMHNNTLDQAPVNATNNSNNSSGGADRSPYPERVAGRHSRQNSFISTPGGGNSSLSDATLKTAFENKDMGGIIMGSVEQEQEKEQDILELMLACNPQDTAQDQHQPYGNRQHGNLVRDLVAVFHSLSRNDHDYPPTPSSLLCERDAVVYVNQHFAIPIDAAGLSGHSRIASFVQGIPLSQQHKIGSVPISEGGLPVVRPYYTLLFPHASPSELLQTFYSSGSATPQQMENLLLTVNPHKPLTQIAADANLPMHTTIQIASFLIAHGACITSPVVSSSSRLTCFGSDSIQRIPELALEFSQMFPRVSLFGVVSFLTTSSRSLGDAMAVLTDTENEEGAWLRESLLASTKYRGIGGGGEKVGLSNTDSVDTNIAKSMQQMVFSDEKNESSYSPTVHASFLSTSRGVGPKSSGLAAEATPISIHQWIKDLEDLLLSITVWLLSHRVLVHLQEYMVSVAEDSSSVLTAIGSNGEKASSSSVQSSQTPVSEKTPKTTKDPAAASFVGRTSAKSSNSDWDENLFQELLDMEYLNGDISIMALSWRMAIDPRKLRMWGFRHKRVKILSRVPSAGDDWELATATESSSLSPLESHPTYTATTNLSA